MGFPLGNQKGFDSVISRYDGAVWPLGLKQVDMPELAIEQSLRLR